MKNPVFMKRLPQALCSPCWKLFAGHEASQAGQRCAVAFITLSSAACEHVAAYLEQTVSKVSSFLILKGKVVFFFFFPKTWRLQLMMIPTHLWQSPAGWFPICAGSGFARDHVGMRNCWLWAQLSCQISVRGIQCAYDDDVAYICNTE